MDNITFRVVVNHETLAACITPSDDNKQMKIGRYLKEAREREQLTQAKLQQLCGWGEGNSRISNYEQDGREPSLGDLEVIGKNLNLSVSELIARAETKGVGEHPASYAMPRELRRLMDAAHVCWGLVPPSYFEMIASSFEILASHLSRSRNSEHIRD